MRYQNFIFTCFLAWTISMSSTHSVVQQEKTKHIIWDIGYTLFKPDQSKIASLLGYWDCFCVYFKHGNGCQKTINELFFDILSDDNQVIDESTPKDPEGRPLPRLMCDWFRGMKTSEDVLEEAIMRWQKYSKFTSKRYKRIVLNTIHWLFDPWLFATTMKPIPQAGKLLRDCHRSKKKDGTPKNKFYILSNLDSDSFLYLYKKRSNQSFFKYFKPQNIFISSFIRDLKPRPSIFQFVLKYAKLNPADCILIDDQIENCKAAQRCGMTALHVNKGDYDTVRKELKKLGAL